MTRCTARLLLVALVPLALAGCSGGGTGVSVDTVRTDDVREVVDAPGTVAASATATVTATAAGTVTQLAVSDGQQVAAGDLLFVVDSPQAREQLAQAREADTALDLNPTVPAVSLGGTQAQARAAAAEAFADARTQAEAIEDPEVRRATLLSIQTAQAQYDLSVASADAAALQVQAGVSALADAVAALGEAQRVQTRAAVSAAARTVDALTVRAPIAGKVSLTAPASGGGSGVDLADAASLLSGAGASGGADLSALTGGGGGGEVSGVLREGQPVTSGQAVLTITDDSQLSVTAQIDETDILLITTGTAGRIALDALPDQPLDATVTTIDPAPTTSARGGVAFTARLPLPGDLEEKLLPGMSAIVSLTVREAPDVPVLPATAVVRRDDGDAVWAVDDDGRARLRPVTLGVIGDGVVEVRDGVTTGDRVVVAGADVVSEGQDVG